MARLAVASAIALGSVPPVVRAADRPAPIVLPGTTVTAITADIDADGARELVRLADVSGSTVLETWDIVDGDWAATFSVDILALGAGPTVNVGEVPVALVAARVAGIERVLVLSGRIDVDSGMPGCCVTAHEVVDSGGGPEARRLAMPDVEAESVVVFDVDADGTDELAFTVIRWNEQGDAATTSVAVTRRERDAWTSAGTWAQEGPWWVNLAADADGEPGHELLASGETGEEVVRLAWTEAGMVESRTSMLFGGEQGWVNGSITERLVVALPTAVGLAEWPADGEPVLVATYETRDYPTVGVLGSGPDALFVVQDHDGSGAPNRSVSILDANLDPVGEVAIAPEAAALWDRLERLMRNGWNSSRNIWPYAGPVDGDRAGGARSYIVGGMQITAGPAGTFDARRIRSLVTQPIGTVGPEGAWVALADGFYGGGPVAYLSSGWFGMKSRLTLAPASALLEPVDQDLATGVRLDGAVETGRTGETVSLLAAPSGAEIVVTLAADTVALSSDGSQLTDHGAGETTVRIEIRAPRRPPRDRPAEFERELLLVGPEGNVSYHRWEGTFAPEAPELTAWTTAEPLSMHATVGGRTAPGSTVTVDGRVVALNGSGAYRATVDAPPWPRSVVIVSRDPFGGERRATVEVIGLVDYRGLPWVPIAGVATVLGGAALFLRTPNRRPLADRPVLDDGRLEDLDADVF